MGVIRVSLTTQLPADPDKEHLQIYHVRVYVEGQQDFSFHRTFKTDKEARNYIYYLNMKISEIAKEVRH